jgi:hypothetical protein
MAGWCREGGPLRLRECCAKHVAGCCGQMTCSTLGSFRGRSVYPGHVSEVK